MRRFLVIERPELDGSQTFDVERVEILVRHERQPAASWFSRLRARRQQGRVGVFEAATALTEHIEKHVAVEREAAPERADFFDHLLDLLRRFAAVPLFVLPGVDDDVRRPIDNEFADFEAAGDDG